MRLLVVLVLAWACSITNAKRTCLSTRKTARLGCSAKCKAERADRHCQACICAACAFCNTGTAAAIQPTSSNYRVGGGYQRVAQRAPATASSSSDATDDGTSSSADGRSRRRSRSNGDSRVQSRRSRPKPILRSFDVDEQQPQKQQDAEEEEEQQQPTPIRRRRRKRARVRTVAETSAEQLGTGRRWVAAVQESVADSIRNLNRTVTSMVLRTLGYVPGPQLPLEFGGYLGDFSVAGAKQLPHEAMVTMLHAEIGAAGPVPRSVREQRMLARKAAKSGAKPQKVDWHNSPVAGLLPGRAARPPTPKARAKKRRKQLLGEVELGGSLANLTLRSRDGAAAASKRKAPGQKKPKRRGKKMKEEGAADGPIGRMRRNNTRAAKALRGHPAKELRAANKKLKKGKKKGKPPDGDKPVEEEEKKAGDETKASSGADEEEEASTTKRPRKRAKKQRPAKKGRCKAESTPAESPAEAAGEKGEAEGGDGAQEPPLKKKRVRKKKRRKPPKPQDEESSSEEEKKADSPMEKAKEETSEASDAAAKPAKKRKKKAKKQAKKGDESSHERKARKARLRGRVIADLPGA